MPKKILIVDPNKSTTTRVKRALLKAGYDVSIIPTCTLALPRIIHRKPDLILLEIDMGENEVPFYLLKQLQENPATEKIPVFFFSKRMDDKDILIAGIYKVKCYIIKPFRSKVLLDRIGEFFLKEAPLASTVLA